MNEDDKLVLVTSGNSWHTRDR